MSLLATNARQMLREATTSDFGIRVSVANVGAVVAPVLRAKQILYRFKSEDTDFKNLTVKLDPDDPDKFLWLLKSDIGDPE